ncbi:MAG: hypothetical protein J6S67_12625 [Methanobrevibacter sp.]|nr:hypothetical protein [Methanobrevibacter sp.]
MKKIANLVALIICVTLLSTAAYKNSKKRQFNRLLGEYLYSLHYSTNNQHKTDVDISHFTPAEEATARRVNKICAQYGGKNLKILVKYDYDLPTTKFWNAYTQKLDDGVFLIVTSTDNERTLHHEVAHVLAWDEKDFHGEEWKDMFSRMGYRAEASRY